MKHSILTLLVFVIFFYSCKPEQTVPRLDETFNRHQKISLDYEDSVIYFRVVERNEIEPELEKYYTWFNKDTLVTTQGQFGGKLLNGEFEVLLQNGRKIIRKGVYEEGLKHGKWITWHPNGTIKSVYTYEEGVLQGDFLIQKENGKPISKGKYGNDLLDGVSTYYQADTVNLAIRYRKGIPTDTIQ